MSNKDNSTPLSGYRKTKKVLTPPLAAISGMKLASWVSDRFPDMLWAALIRERHPGAMGYAIYGDILRWLAENKADARISGVTHTDIACYDSTLRKSFINYVVEVAGTDALRPLLLFEFLPAFGDWKASLASVNTDVEADWSHLADAVLQNIHHQSQEATDIRWVKLMGAALGGSIHIPWEQLEKMNYYPHKYDQRSVRPSIRSMEVSFALDNNTNEWILEFWKYNKDETVCMPDEISRPDELKKAYGTSSKDKKYYSSRLDNARQQLVDHFYDSATTTAVDSRHETVFGIAVYALDIFFENCILLTSTTVNSRISLRILFESYITLKYLLKRESQGQEAWDGYREYGIGQASLIEKSYSERGLSSQILDMETMRMFANEDKWSEFVPINVGNWDASSLRAMCIEVREKTLYDTYYPYTSGFIHASWSAVREASMQLCLNPLHRFHRIPSYGLPALPPGNEDCRLILNKILRLVNKAYPGYTYQLRKRPVNSL